MMSQIFECLGLECPSDSDNSECFEKKMQGDFLDVGERLGDVGREIFYKEEKEMSKLQDFLNLFL